MMKGYPVSSSNTTPNSSPSHSRTGTPPSLSPMATLNSLLGQAALGNGVAPLNLAALNMVRGNVLKASGKNPF